GLVQGPEAETDQRPVSASPDQGQAVDGVDAIMLQIDRDALPSQFVYCARSQTVADAVHLEGGGIQARRRYVTQRVERDAHLFRNEKFATRRHRKAIARGHIAVSPVLFPIPVILR